MRPGVRRRKQSPRVQRSAKAQADVRRWIDHPSHSEGGPAVPLTSVPLVRSKALAPRCLADPLFVHCVVPAGLATVGVSCGGFRGPCGAPRVQRVDGGSPESGFGAPETARAALRPDVTHEFIQNKASLPPES